VWRLWGFRQEKSLVDATFYWNQETLARFSLHESVDSQPRVAKFFIGSGFFRFTKFLACQLSSRTRVRPSPSGISLGCQAGLTPSPPSSLKLRRSRRLRRARWSKHSGSALVGSLSWLNQFRPGSSSGIPSLMAYQITRSGRFAGLLVGGGAERRR